MFFRFKRVKDVTGGSSCSQLILEDGSHHGQYPGKRGAKPSRPLSSGCQRIHSCSAKVAHHWYIVIGCSVGEGACLPAMDLFD